MIIKLYFFYTYDSKIIYVHTSSYTLTCVHICRDKLKFKMFKFLIVPGSSYLRTHIIPQSRLPTFHHQGFLTDLDSFCTIYAIILSLVQLDYNQKMKGILDLQKKRNCSFSFY